MVSNIARRQQPAIAMTDDDRCRVATIGEELPSVLIVRARLGSRLKGISFRNTRPCSQDIVSATVEGQASQALGN